MTSFFANSLVNMLSLLLWLFTCLFCLFSSNSVFSNTTTNTRPDNSTRGQLRSPPRSLDLRWRKECSSDLWRSCCGPCQPGKSEAGSWILFSTRYQSISDNFLRALNHPLVRVTGLDTLSPYRTGPFWKSNLLGTCDDLFILFTCRGSI